MTTIDTLQKNIESQEFWDKLLDIYGDVDRNTQQQERYHNALEKFREQFGDVPVAVFSAPGRTEIGGNRTDHQHGCVLAASINVDAIAVTAPREDGQIRVLSEGYPIITLELPADSISTGSQDNETGNLDHGPNPKLAPLPEEEGTTRGLIRGMAAGLLERGYRIGGFDAYITSEVLGGSGLSSSAAFETLIGTILSGLYNEMSVDAVTIAKIGQYAENIYFGKPCGLMDQMACSVGSLCYMDFNDPEDPKYERIRLDLHAAGFRLCITDTKGSHADLTPDYAAVPAEMKAVAAHFGKEVLREVSELDFRAAIPALREKLGDRPILRALHFYAENTRARHEATALKNGDFAYFLQLVRESGDSSFKYLQNVYTSRDVQHQNISLALAVSDSVLESAADSDDILSRGVARVHGGGFAGTIQAFVPVGLVSQYRQAMEALFGPGSCMVLQIRKYGGMQVL